MIVADLTFLLLRFVLNHICCNTYRSIAWCRPIFELTISEWQWSSTGWARLLLPFKLFTAWLCWGSVSFASEMQLLLFNLLGDVTLCSSKHSAGQRRIITASWLVHLHVALTQPVDATTGLHAIFCYCICANVSVNCYLAADLTCRTHSTYQIPPCKPFMVSFMVNTSQAFTSCSLLLYTAPRFPHWCHDCCAYIQATTGCGWKHQPLCAARFR